MNVVGSSFLLSLWAVLNIALEFLQWMILVWAILSWIIFFTYQSAFRWRHRQLYSAIEQIYSILSRTFSPLLRPFRRLLPAHKTGGIDWSPMLLLLAIYFVRIFVNSLVAGFMRQ